MTVVFWMYVASVVSIYLMLVRLLVEPKNARTQVTLILISVFWPIVIVGIFLIDTLFGDFG